MPGESRYAWSESPEEVANGIYRVPLPMPTDRLRAVNVYAIEGDDGLSLIDSGWAVPASREALVQALAGLGRTVHDIRRFLVTHLHPDHYAQASVLRPETGSKVLLGEGERLSLDAMLHGLAAGTGNQPNMVAALMRAGAASLVAQLTPGRTVDAEVLREWQPPDEWLIPGAAVDAGNRRLAVVATPGHTRGHVVFHDESDRLLFSGDHILPLITPSIGLETSGARWPLRDFVDSLHLIRQRPDARLLPAHGPVRDSAHQRVDELLHHHEVRLIAALKAVEAGAATGWEVAQQLTWTYHELPVHELDPRNRAMAVRETMAHLDVLVLDGALSVTSRDGVEYFTAGGAGAE